MITDKWRGFNLMSVSYTHLSGVAAASKNEIRCYYTLYLACQMFQHLMSPFLCIFS